MEQVARLEHGVSHLGYGNETLYWRGFEGVGVLFHNLSGPAFFPCDFAAAKHVGRMRAAFLLHRNAT
jgi:hypothetical protein